MRRKPQIMPRKDEDKLHVHFYAEQSDWPYEFTVTRFCKWLQGTVGLVYDRCQKVEFGVNPQNARQWFMWDPDTGKPLIGHAHAMEFGSVLQSAVWILKARAMGVVFHPVPEGML